MRLWIPFSIVLISVGLALAAVASALLSPLPPRLPAAQAEGDQPKTPAEHVAEALAAGEKLRKQKVYEKALYEYNRVLFVDAKNSKAKKGVRKIRDEQAAAYVEKSEASWEGDPVQSMRELLAAYEASPGNRDVKSLFKKRGYRLHEGRWLTKDGIKEFEAAREAKGLARRNQLGLSKRFTVLHRGPLRLFTNVDVENAPGNLIGEIIQSNLTHYNEYVTRMRPLGVRFPEEGVDMVLFDTQGGYMSYTRAEGTAGVYIPSKRCGFFFRNGGHVSFPTMLHEMTHQLCDKVLQGLSLSGWFEEGMAEYYGSGLLTKGGRRLRLGFTDGYRLASFHRALNRGGGGLIPLAKFTEMQQAELTSQFYAQAWALVHYLMEGDPVGRLIIYDYVASGKLHRKKAGAYAPFSLKMVLERYGKSLDSLEDDYVQFYKK